MKAARERARSLTLTHAGSVFVLLGSAVCRAADAGCGIAPTPSTTRGAPSAARE